MDNIKNLKEILIKNEWFSEEELNKVWTPEIETCIKECSRPHPSEVFNAFDGLKPQDVKVLIIGQDPYPDIERAHGLAFSFKNGSLVPEDSLKNIFEKLKNELGINNTYTNLTCWKKQQVLLLNTSLTYKKADDKKEQGNVQKQHLKHWDGFVNNVLKKLTNSKKKNKQPLVVMLWGRKANELKEFAYKGLEQENIFSEENPNILILRSSHPSNLYLASSRKIYSGDVAAFNDNEYRPFIDCNTFLKKHNTQAIDWVTRD